MCIRDSYKDGLQRAKFLKTVNFINKNFLIHNLLGSEDYRLKEIAKFDSSAKDGNSFGGVKDFLQSDDGMMNVSLHLNFFVMLLSPFNSSVIGKRA